MGFGLEYLFKKGDEVRPDMVPLPPVVRVFFEELPEQSKGEGRVYITENNSERVEIFVDDYIRGLDKTQIGQFKKELRETAVEKYRGRFQQWAVGQRDNIDRPGISNIYHKQYADNELTMDYYSHYNASRLDITVRAAAVTELLGEIIIDRMDALCMFIFYGGNKILVSRMSCFRSGNFRKLARFTQKSENWGFKPAITTEMCFDGTHPVILGQIIRGAATKSWRRESSFAFGLASRSFRNMPRCGRYWMPALCSPEKDLPVLNGNGNTVYTVKSTGVIDYHTKRVDVEERELDVPVYGVDSEGTKYYGLLVETGYMHFNFMFAPEDVEGAGEQDFMDLPEAMESQYKQETEGTDPQAHIMARGHSAVGENLATDYTEAKSDQPIKPDMTLPGYSLNHSARGGVDEMWYKRVKITVHTEWVESGAYYDSLEFKYGDLRVYINSGNDGASQDKYSASQVMWPPKARFEGALWLRDENKILSTDWGRCDSLKSWLFVSNGEYVIQGIIKDDNQILEFEGGDFSSTVERLTGSSVENVQCIYLGLPLTLVTKK